MCKNGKVQCLYVRMFLVLQKILDRLSVDLEEIYKGANACTILDQIKLRILPSF